MTEGLIAYNAVGLFRKAKNTANPTSAAVAAFANPARDSENHPRQTGESRRRI